MKANHVNGSSRLKILAHFVRLLRMIGSILLRAREIKFYTHIFIALAPTILFGSFFPQIISQLQFWGSDSIVSQRLIVLLDILISVGLALRVVKSCWKKFVNEGDIQYRPDVISIVIFLFFFVILDSGLFVFISTKMPLYQFFLNKSDYLNVAKWTLLINSAIATLAAIAFIILNWLFSYFYSGVHKMPLWSSTLTLSLVPTLIGFVPVAVFAEQGFASYVFVAAFPFILALLATLGYSHPLNRLDAWVAKALFITSIISCFFGFLIAMGGLMWYLSEPHAPLAKYTTLFSPIGYPIDWASMPYPHEEYPWRWREGFIWMVLTGIFFMELCPGFMAVFTIFRYQLQGRGKNSIT